MHKDVIWTSWPAAPDSIRGISMPRFIDSCARVGQNRQNIKLITSVANFMRQKFRRKLHLLEFILTLIEMFPHIFNVEWIFGRILGLAVSHEMAYGLVIWNKWGQNILIIKVALNNSKSSSYAKSNPEENFCKKNIFHERHSFRFYIDVYPFEFSSNMLPSKYSITLATFC